MEGLAIVDLLPLEIGARLRFSSPPRSVQGWLLHYFRRTCATTKSSRGFDEERHVPGARGAADGFPDRYLTSQHPAKYISRHFSRNQRRRAQGPRTAFSFDGGIVVRNYLTSEELAQIEQEIRPHLDANTELVDEFLPKETRRVTGLAEKSRLYLERICHHPLFSGVCDKLLTSTYQYWMGDSLKTSVSRPQLHATTVFSIGPGARPQDLHRDDINHHTYRPAVTVAEYVPGRETAIGCFVAGKKTSRANGATRFIPGSHLQSSLTPPVEADAVYAEMEPGEAFFMFASCYHGGSANTTEDEERLVYGTFVTKGYLRQEENQYLVLPLETVRQHPEELQQFLGYGMSSPFLGWIDLKSPLKVLFGNENASDQF
ncbi:hypothetical protein PV04_10629 [Phialophora macrospora]|uniref:Phytanoyl-CoA dioxygenase n=1 Tax=Phialophora macrospora TaxID=1851006 RepID=A0A0D2CBS1_9EURO|nr:hypothetical protein PV04_10629 [Phialophora macrospora]